MTDANNRDVPASLYSGKWGKCHCQGIAVDPVKRFIYYSFTTLLVKCDFDGNVVGSAGGLTGHLGCIVFNPADGCVYASLEYKNDKIGSDILLNLGLENKPRGAGFYIAVFDADKIIRPDMNAAADGIMLAAFLKEAADDYAGNGRSPSGDPVPHKYGCSGIDGIAIGPDFGSADKTDYITVAYGIYSDLNRADNDCQVLLQYDLGAVKASARPLTPDNMHTNGPAAPRNKFFAFTGNTYYGIQNLEYDAFTRCYIACVYRGFKPQYPPYTLFALDAAVKPVENPVPGVGENGKMLTLRNIGGGENGIYGLKMHLGDSEFGALGLYSFGNGLFYAARPDWSDKDNLSVTVLPFKLDAREGNWKFIPAADDEKTLPKGV